MVIAYQMVFEQRQRRKEETAEAAIDDEELSSLATFPLAIPLMAGSRCARSRQTLEIFYVQKYET